jgi:hypothetical protein
MFDSTMDVCQMKQEILTFCNKLSINRKLSARLGRVKTKFLSDMIYGMIATGSVILSDIADSLREPIQKKNTLERLPRGLKNRTRTELFKAHCRAFAAGRFLRNLLFWQEQYRCRESLSARSSACYNGNGGCKFGNDRQENPRIEKEERLEPKDARRAYRHTGIHVVAL